MKFREEIIQTVCGYFEWLAEIGFHWMKDPMAISPIFLKKPERIQALGLIFILVSMNMVFQGLA